MAFALLMACRLSTMTASRHRLSTRVEETKVSEEATSVKIDGFVEAIKGSADDLQKDMMKDRSQQGVGTQYVTWIIQELGKKNKSELAAALNDKLWENVGGINTDGDMKQELLNVGLDTFQFAVSLANPVLGAAVAVLFSLFVKEGEDDMEKKILAQVEDMFKEFKLDLLHDQLRTKITNVERHVRTQEELFKRDNPQSATRDWNTNLDNWKKVHDDLLDSTSTVFDRCWSNKDSSECSDWRTSKGGATALMYELKFTELLVANELNLKMLGYKHADIEIPGLKDELHKAGQLAYDHAVSWKQFRTKTEVTKSRVNCGAKGKFCRIAELGVDRYTDKTLDRFRETYYGCTSASKQAAETCYNKVKNKIAEECQSFVDEAYKLTKAIEKVKRLF